MVCAMLRRAPIREYLELEDHPAIKVEYTFSLEIHKNKRIPKGRIKDGVLDGYKAHKRSARTKLSIGAK